MEGGRVSGQSLGYFQVPWKHSQQGWLSPAGHIEVTFWCDSHLFHGSQAISTGLVRRQCWVRHKQYGLYGSLAFSTILYSVVIPVFQIRKFLTGFFIEVKFT